MSEGTAAPPAETQREALTIREFRLEDIDGLFILEQRCYDGTLAMTYPQLRTLLKDSGIATLVVVGETDGKPRMAGALIVKREAEAQRMMVVSLMVDPDYRRLGLGARLAGWSVRLAAAAGLPAVALPLEAENAPGAAFLRAQGFAPAESGAPFFTGPEDGTLWVRPAQEAP